MKLTIKNLQYGDFGNYRCISKNSLGETEGSIRVYGKYKEIKFNTGRRQKNRTKSNGLVILDAMCK